MLDAEAGRRGVQHSALVTADGRPAVVPEYGLRIAPDNGLRRVYLDFSLYLYLSMPVRAYTLFFKLPLVSENRAEVIAGIALIVHGE